MQRLVDVPSKDGDVTSVLQAISKLIYDKLRPEVIQSNLAQNVNQDNVRYFINRNEKVYFFINSKKLIIKGQHCSYFSRFS
jgi:hypothetical protein